MSNTKLKCVKINKPSLLLWGLEKGHTHLLELLSIFDFWKFWFRSFLPNLQTFLLINQNFKSSNKKNFFAIKVRISLSLLCWSIFYLGILSFNLWKNYLILKFSKKMTLGYSFWHCLNIYFFFDFWKILNKRFQNLHFEQTNQSFLVGRNDESKQWSS